MSNLKVIKRKYLPTGLPIQASLLWWLVFDKMLSKEWVGEWVWGVYWTLFVILWTICISIMVLEEDAEPVFK